MHVPLAGSLNVLHHDLDVWAPVVVCPLELRLWDGLNPGPVERRRWYPGCCFGESYVELQVRSAKYRDSQLYIGTHQLVGADGV